MTDVPHGTRRCRAAAPGISPEAAARLFGHLRNEGIPLEQSVPFLIRARGWRIQSFCDEIGIHRAHFHALLLGQYAAGFKVRMPVDRLLGFDPWAQNDPAPG